MLEEAFFPGRLGERLRDEENVKPRMFRGAAIFIIGVFSAILTAFYMVYTKVDMSFALEGFESARPPLPTPGEIALSRLLYMGLAFMIIFVGFRLIVFFAGKEGRGKALLTLVFHAFLVFTIISLATLPIMSQAHRIPFIVVDATLADATFHDAEITGIAVNGSITLRGTINAEYVSVYRAYRENLSKPVWASMRSEEDVAKALEETSTIINMTGVTLSDGGSLDRVDLVEGNWSRVEYRDVVSRGLIRFGAPEPGLVENILSTLSPIAWALTVLYVMFGFKRLYQVSSPITIIAGVLVMVILVAMGVA